MAEKTDLLQQQLELIYSRWPDVHQQLVRAEPNALSVSVVNTTTLSINGIQLTSAWDRKAEARLQAEQIPPGKPVIYLYGTGLGDCAQTLLLRKKLQQLHCIILNRAVFLQTLAIEEQRWLSDIRVTLHLPQEFPEIQLPFIVNPAELLLAEESSFILRDRLELELNSSYIQQQHRAENSISQQKIAANYKFLEQDRDISTLNTFNWQEKTVFIAAAGPTLEDHFNWLAENRPALIAVDAAVSSLVENGIIPDIVISIDAYSSRLFNDKALTKLNHTPLVYFPGVDSELLERWQGNRYYSRSATPMYAHLPAQFKKTSLFSAGSVLHPAIDLAVTLKAQEIILMGADFSFVKGKSHANPEKSDKSKIALERANHFIINGLGEKVPTIQNFKGYLRDLERYIEKNPQVLFFNASEKGAKIMGTRLWQP